MKISPVLAVLLLVGCAETGRTPGVGAGTRDASYLCTDQDGDGYGEGCALGGDCNDTDPLVHSGCLSCANPAEGCACDNGNRPISCYLEPTANDDGGMMCHEGTRYCRDGEWSACESVFSYPKPEPTVQTQAVINKDAGVEKCSDCRPNCYIIRDNLGPTDGGVGDAGVNTKINDAGGLVINTYTVDAGPMDASTYDAAACMVGAAPDKDCDGILDIYDPYPTTKPFATTNPTIFLDIAAGATGTGVVNLAFYLNSADVYFLLDQTGSMNEERVNLVAGLTTGDYVNNATYKCSDYDFDGMPNNELKTKGVIGAIRCYIREANFGAGFFRELPFDQHSGSYPYTPWQYASDDEIAFRNFVDVTNDISKVSSGLAQMSTQLNMDWEEAAMPGLYTLVTGNGMYFGTDRKSVPTRASCPANTFGYPCFRKDAIPIVVLFTDAPSHNGPTTNTLPYANNLYITKNTNGTALEGYGNDTFLTAQNAGDLTSSYVTYAGDTSTLASDSPLTTFTCATLGGAPDAFYKFNLTQTKTVTISTEQSEFDTVVGLWGSIPATPTSVASASGNDGFSSAYNFGDITNKYVVTSGTTSGLSSDYLANDLSCGAYAGSPDAAFKFTLASPTKVAFDTQGSSLGTSLSLFSGTPTVPMYTANTNNNNDKLDSAYKIGNINGLMKSYSGTTNVTSITADYTAAQVGCGTVDTATDAVYEFGLTSAARVRISNEDSALKAVLALVDNNGNQLTTSTAYSNNDNTGSNSANIDLGVLDGKALRVTGNTNTTGINTDYDPTVTGCNASGRDAVFKFTLNTPREVQIDSNTSYTAFDTVLSLFKTSITSSTSAVTGSTTYENLATAGYPGALDAKHYVITGTTTGMAANYAGTQQGSCNTAAANASPDAVYRLHLNAKADVRLDTLGSSFDTVLSLHSALPDLVTTTISTGDTIGAPYAIGNAANRNALFQNTGTGTTSFAADVAIEGPSCVAHAAAPDAVFTFNIGTAGNYQIDTIGSSFNTVLAVYPSNAVSALPSATAVPGTGNNGDTSGTAVDVGSLNANAWKSYTGAITSSFAADKTDFTGCGASGSGGKDAYFKFTVPGSGTQTITIDTIGSAFDTVLGVFTSSFAAVPSGVAASYCNDNGANPGDKFVGNFTGGQTYYAIVKSKASGTYGNYKITFRGNTALAAPGTGCDDDSGGSGTSKLTLNLSSGNYVAVVKGKAATDKGTYKLAVKHLDWVNAGGKVLACSDDADASNTSSRIDYPNLAAGDYYVVVKGKNNTTSGYGSYVLSMQDFSAPPSGWIACDDDETATTTSSSMVQTLPAGTYWVVVKGKNGASTTRGAYGLDIFDTSAKKSSVIDCDYGSGTGGTSALEADLAAGTYRVIVKGKASTDKGAYKLQVRDLTGLPAGTGRLNCDYQSGVGNKSYFEQQLNAGTYTVLLKGDAASGGAYKLSVRDATNITATETPLACNNDVSVGDTTSKITKSLGPGTYYVGVKGSTSLASGRYQISMGAGSTSTGTKYTPPTWTETLNALKANKVRVIPILSCKDDPDHGNTQGDCNTARTQYTALANATGALGSSSQPLITDIDHLGTGISSTVVKNIVSLAQYLEMNVSAQVAFDPDPNPGFILNIKAVSKAGDGCSGVVGNEFQKCMPGATPRFEISFTNPASSPVPRNSLAKDPNGGYNFKAQLIANSQFVVDTVPIYIIPENVTTVPPQKVYPTGTYNQTLTAPGCATATDLPDWSDLTWSGTFPNGTSVQFAVCGGANASAAASCTPINVCKVTGGAACSASSPCPTGSFCSTAGNCNTITGNTCTTSANCPSQATCRSGTCVFDGQPIDVGDILGSQNGRSNLRVQITLNANTSSNVGPTVSDWQINYLCKDSL